MAVRGDVSAVLGPNAFTLLGTPPDAMGGLLVVGAAGQTDASPYPSQRVEVLGTVHEFHPADIEAAVGVHLDDGNNTIWEGSPAIIVRSIVRGAANPPRVPM